MVPPRWHSFFSNSIPRVFATIPCTQWTVHPIAVCSGCTNSLDVVRISADVEASVNVRAHRTAAPDHDGLENFVLPDGTIVLTLSPEKRNRSRISGTRETCTLLYLTTTSIMPLHVPDIISRKFRRYTPRPLAPEPHQTMRGKPGETHR
ncbi:hypothetical protein LshimejAT787_2300540 [Lyophyllum shimeji]|uniref:Uncharacterized protein n=1 Tax=Lyophyllum shimeji TaxID=47721 RepID=A0A9P3Q1S4_LYOSH|nr:hypothetical protein LshimejAT787_2300540 [Lyophyllum shimeji]